MYEEWKAGGISWIECPIMIADRVSEYEDVISIATGNMAKAITKRLFNDGAELAEPVVSTWTDLMNQAKVINTSIRSDRECLPEQYIYMAYHLWLDQYSKSVEWANMSLWGYVKHWLRRVFL